MSQKSRTKRDLAPKPYLRLVTRSNDPNTYLSVKQYQNGKDVTLKTFGNADITENWDLALNYLLDRLKKYYNLMKYMHISRHDIKKEYGI